jgi:hypothetical protein
MLVTIVEDSERGRFSRQAQVSFKAGARLRTPAIYEISELRQISKHHPSLSHPPAKVSRIESNMVKSYHEDPKWSDVTPLPQDDGSLHPLAAIAYTEEYSEAMDYLRAVMAKNEFSERVLGLTEHIISMNPAHYTVW